MQWDEVMESGIVPLFEDDTTLVGPTGLNGKYIFAKDSSLPVRIPALLWVIIEDTETEVFNPIHVQFDIYGKMDVIRTVEGQIRKRLRSGVRRTIGGVNMSTIYEDSYTQHYPAQPGILQRSLRYLFEPVRRRAVTES